MPFVATSPRTGGFLHSRLAVSAHSSRLAVFIVGATCSGKTEAGRFLSTLGFTWIEPSKYVKRDVPLDLPVLERLRAVDTFFSHVGHDYVAKCLLSETDSLPESAQVVITGCRQLVEIEILKSSFKTLVLGVYADDQIRYARAKQRSRLDVPDSFESFLRATAWEYSIGLGRIFFLADDVIVNNGDRRDFLNRLEQSVKNGGLR